MEKSPYIDALRGWAILGVITVHTHQTVNGLQGWFKNIASQGARGVQLFFIVSALTLFMSLNARRASEAGYIKNFFIRRFFRIAPLFYFGIFFYTFTDGLSPRYWAPDGITYWHLWATGVFFHGWFPTSFTSVVPGGWSIGNEMNFYLLVPFLFFLSKDHYRAFLLGTVLALLSLKINLIAEPFLNSYPDYLIKSFLLLWLPSQLPIFLLGFGLYFMVKRLKTENKNLSWFLTALAGTAFVYLSFSGLSGTILHFFYGIVFVLFGLALHLYANPFFVNKASCYIGTISYSAYLSHFFVIRLFRPIMPELENGLIELVFFESIVIIVTIGVSELLYRYIEQPGIKLGRKLINNNAKARLEWRNNRACDTQGD